MKGTNNSCDTDSINSVNGEDVDRIKSELVELRREVSGLRQDVAEMRRDFINLKSDLINGRYMEVLQKFYLK